jgi:hypothetical protein
VEGELLMENVPADKMTKESNKNEETMTEIKDIRASHDVDAIMTDDKDEEIVFEQEHGTNMSTGSDSKEASSSLSSSDSSLSSDSDSDTSSKMVCTKVVQGEKYEKPDGWSSDDNKIEVFTAPRETNMNNKDGKRNKDFVKVPIRNNRTKQTKKQKKIYDTKHNAERMERANELLQMTNHEK